MKKFLVTQDADYVVGHLRYGHREGVIEAENIDEVKAILKDGGTDYLDLVVDDYEVEDVDYGDNEFEIEEYTERE